MAGLQYNIYANDGAGGPIDYSTIIASTYDHEWLDPSTLSDGVWRFGVRAYDYSTGLEDLNLDASVTVIIADGVDVTNRPKAPLSLRAVPQIGGGMVLEWIMPISTVAKRPTGFHVYGGTPTISYTTALATVTSASLLGTYRASLTGLTAGAAYQFGVRAYNSTGEEDNTIVVTATPVSTGPDAVDGLVGVAVSVAESY